MAAFGERKRPVIEPFEHSNPICFRGLLAPSRGAGQIFDRLDLFKSDDARLTAIDEAKLHAMIRAASGPAPVAPVAELVDALDSKSSSARSAGSIPARGTNLMFVTIRKHPKNR